MYTQIRLQTIWVIFYGCLVCIYPKVNSSLRGATTEQLNALFAEYCITEPSVVSAGGQFISHDLENAKFLSESHYYRKRKKRSLNELETIEVAYVGENTATNHSHGIDVRNDVYRNNVDDSTDLDEITQNFSTDETTQNFFTDEITQNFSARNRRMSNETQRQLGAQREPELIARRSKLYRRYLHFNVSVFGNIVQLRVEKKQTLIAPGAKSIIFFEDGRKIEKVLSSSCLFYGTIPEHPRSKVAISNCNGLYGLIQTESEEFYIEPIEAQPTQRTERPQRHIIYRRPSKGTNIGKRMERKNGSRDFKRRRKHKALSSSVESLLERQKEKAFTRRKRHTKTNDYNIEVFLVADNEVVRFHGRDHVENYLLTLINIVDEIYHDTSLGEHVNMVLSRLYQLDERRSNNLIKDSNPTLSLKNVCKWAHRMHQVDPPSHGRSHDYSIFLTRKNFGPAGYAHVSGMCQPLRSCSLTYEDGFSSAFVVAHETGHVLGMEHDGEGNRCGDETSMGSIMAPLVQAAFHRYHWSRCSQQELQTNLRSFHCLSDDPNSLDLGPVPIYPGVTYTMDDQCRFDFGQGYKRCTAFRNVDVCKTLWCSHDENPLFCKTKKGPPVDGTECGTNMWCFKSRCMWRDQRHRAVNGNWGAWTAYSDCSRSCGTGVKYRSRLCNNPAPAKGGTDCVGENVSYDLCNKRPCPTSRDFRADQCLYRNNEVEFNNQRHTWLPYEPLATDLKCDLYCISKKTQDVVTMGDYVADGTQCSYDDPHGICIHGECVNVGCDRVINSRRREDICGVCGGDGSHCRNISSKITKRANRKANAYLKLLKIPAGARHVRIEELSGSNNENLLALKSRSAKRYLLNGKKKTTEEATPHRWISLGALWTYESTRDVETIRTHGPIYSEVMLMLLVRQRNTRVSITYSYVLQQNVAPKSRDTYSWEIRRWTTCSVTCGSGIRKAKFGCKSQKKRKWVSKKKCKGKPPRSGRKKVCNVECQASTRWVSGEWGNCSVSCGRDGWQERDVKCQRINSIGEIQNVSDQRCLAEQKPSLRRICQTPDCPPQWRTGPWSTCSTSCGQGDQRRQVRCRAVGRTADPAECAEEQPSTIQACEITPCATEETVPKTSTMLAGTERQTSTRQELTSDGCGKKEPAFCSSSAIAQFCSSDSFKKFCCKLCQNSSTTTHRSRVRSENRSNNTNQRKNPDGLLHPTDNIQLRKKRTVSGYDTHKLLQKTNESNLSTPIKSTPLRACKHLLQCRVTKEKGIGPRTSFTKCRGIFHRKKFPRSDDTPYLYCQAWDLMRTLNNKNGLE